MKLTAFILIVCIFFGISAFAEEEGRMAKIAELKGKAEVRLAGEDTWVRAKKGMTLKEGDTVRTLGKSSLILFLNGKAETASVTVEPNSTMMLAELKADESTHSQSTMLDLAIGEILIKAEKLHAPESRFEVKTPTSIVGVRGTTFKVRVEALEK